MKNWTEETTSATGRPTRHQQGTQPVGPRLTAGLQEKFRRTNVFLRFVAGCLKLEKDLVGAGLYVGACSWREPRGDEEREEHEEHPEILLTLGAFHSSYL